MKKILLSSILILSATMGGCSTQKEAQNVSSNSQTTIDKYSVQEKEFFSDKDYVGYVEPLEQSNVGFKLGGRITEIYVSKGDYVKQGQVLAKVDLSEVFQSIQNADNTIASTQMFYNSTNSFFDSQEQVLKEKISQAKKNIELAQINLEGNETGISDTNNISNEQLSSAQKQIDQAQTALDSYKDTYDSTLQLLNQKEDDAYSNAKNALNKSEYLVRTSLDMIDNIYGITPENSLKNDSYETYLSAKNSILKSQVNENFTKQKNYYSQRKEKIESFGNSDLQDSASRSNIYNFLKESQDYLNNISSLLKLAYNGVDSSVSSPLFPETTINSLKTQLVETQNNIQDMLLSVSGNFVVGIKGSIQNIDEIKNTKDLQLTTIEKQIESAKKTLELAKQSYNQYAATSTGQKNQISTKKDVAGKQLQLAKDQYNEAIASLDALKAQRTNQLNQISTQISQIKGSKDLAQVQASNNVITAPFDGIVLEKPAEIGQVVGAGTPVIILATTNNYKIKIYVPDTKLSQVPMGTDVEIKFDGIEKIYTGNVNYIGPSADIYSKKIPIEIKILNPDKDIKLGMYASIGIPGETQKSLAVPYNYIKYKYGDAYILKEKNGETSETKIKVNNCFNDFCSIAGDVASGDIIDLP